MNKIKLKRIKEYLLFMKLFKTVKKKGSRRSLVITILLVIAIICNCATTIAYCYQVNEYETQIDNITNDNLNLKSTISKNETEIKKYKSQAEQYKNELDELKKQSGTLLYLGKFTITHYCCEKYPHICGSGQGITASGAKVQAGVSVAVDRSKIPLGSTVYIVGYGTRIAQDTGGLVKGNRIDIAVSSHEEADKLGTVTRNVWVVI